MRNALAYVTMLSCGFAGGMMFAPTPKSAWAQSATAILPTYAASLRNDDQAEILKQILQELKAIRGGLEAPAAKVQAQAEAQPPPPAVPAGLAVLKANCSTCHTAANAAKKGGGFALWKEDGTLADLSTADRNRVVREMRRGFMPPSKELESSLVDNVETFLKADK